MPTTYRNIGDNTNLCCFRRTVCGTERGQYEKVFEKPTAEEVAR